MAHCIRTKTVLSGLGGRVTRCAKFSGLGAAPKKRRKAKKAKKSRKRRALSGLTQIEAYNKKCGCVNKAGRLKKGWKFKKGGHGQCVKAKKS